MKRSISMVTAFWLATGGCTLVAKATGNVPGGSKISSAAESRKKGNNEGDSNSDSNSDIQDNGGNDQGNQTKDEDSSWREKRKEEKEEKEEKKQKGLPQAEAEAICKAFDTSGGLPNYKFVQNHSILVVTGLKCDGGKVYENQGKIDFKRADFWAHELDGQVQTEILRVVSVAGCIPDNPIDWLKANAWEPKVATAISLCGVDFQRFNRKAYDAELDALKIGPEAKKAAGAFYDETAKSFGVIYNAAKEEGKKDPGYQEFVFAYPERFFQEWEKTAAKYETGLKAFDAVERAFEDAIATQKGYIRLPEKVEVPAECETVKKEFNGYVEANAPKNQAAFDALMKGSIGSTFTAGQVMCSLFANDLTSAAAFQNLIEERSTRGPRMSMRQVIADDIYKWKGEKKMSTPFTNYGEPTSSTALRYVESILEYRIVLSPGKKPVGDNQFEVSGGIVSGVKKTELGIEISFKKDTWEIPEYDCKNTGRTASYQSDGTPIPERDCKFSGKTIKKEYQQPPVVMPAELASAIKTGMYVTTMTGELKQSSNKASLGYPIEIFKDKNKKTLLSVYGFPVK